MSLGEAFSKAATAVGEDASGEPALVRFWSKFATPRFSEDVVPTEASQLSIGNGAEYLYANRLTTVPVVDPFEVTPGMVEELFEVVVLAAAVLPDESASIEDA
jgi:hypothetical protein